MALRRLDCFDYLVTADLVNRFTSLSATTPTVSAGNGRNATASLRMDNYIRGWNLTLDAQATWIVGFAFKFSVLPGGTQRAILTFFDTAVQHVFFALKTDGTIEARMGAGAGTLLGTSTNVFATNTFYYLEFKVTISDTVGVVALRVNGVVDATLNLTGQDTRNAGNSTANVITYGLNSSTASTIDMDDMYILDGTVGDADQPNNDFLGDVRVEALLPSGAGNYAQFTPSAGSNYQNVDDAAPDGDTTYNSSATTNQLDTFAMGNLATATGVVHGVELINSARKTDAGSSILAPVLRISATDYVGADDSLGTGYTYQSDQTYDVSPATGLPFTISEVNAFEVGYKKTS
jgi:hypothetical protein